VFALWGASYSTEQLDSMFQRLKKAGTRHIEVVFTGCQTDIHSSDVDGCQLRDWSFMVSVLDRSIANGFDTTILPLMVTAHYEWRGFFDPTDVDTWFKNYTRWILKVAALAESRKLKEQVIGTEYKILQKYESQWRSVITEVRKVYHGPLIYTGNWDQLDVPFWDAVDAVGISAYFPLSTEKDPPQADLNKAWAELKTKLLALAAKWNRPLHMTEVGYVSGATTAATPWHTPAGDIPDEPLQMRCFEAFRQAWKGEKNLVRASVWATSGPESAGVDVSADPVGRQAEATLNAFFQERAGLAHLGRKRR
jgi:hypothetical protein